jgi:hypothetical protein
VSFLIANGGDTSKMPFHRQDGGYGSTLTGGYGSTLTGGDDSTLTGGYGSTLTGGDDSTLTGGYGSTLLIKYWDAAAGRYRMAMGEVVDGSLKSGVAYRVVDGTFAEVVDEGAEAEQ